MARPGGKYHETFRKGVKRVFAQSPGPSLSLTGSPWLASWAPGLVLCSQPLWDRRLAADRTIVGGSRAAPVRSVTTRRLFAASSEREAGGQRVKTNTKGPSSAESLAPAGAEGASRARFLGEIGDDFFLASFVSVMAHRELFTGRDRRLKDAADR